MMWLYSQRLSVKGYVMGPSCLRPWSAAAWASLCAASPLGLTPSTLAEPAGLRLGVGEAGFPSQAVVVRVRQMKQWLGHCIVMLTELPTWSHCWVCPATCRGGWFLST